jgi:hypothetical protein
VYRSKKCVDSEYELRFDLPGNMMPAFGVFVIFNETFWEKSSNGIIFHVEHEFKLNFLSPDFCIRLI